MTETVAARLRLHSPFDGLDRETLEDVARQVRIRYLEEGETVFTEGHPPLDEVFQIQKGSIEVRRTVGGESVLVALTDAGDVIGLRAHLAERHYAASAVTREPTLLYAIPYSAISQAMDRGPRFARRLAASFAADAPLRGDAMADALRLPSTPPPAQEERLLQRFDETRRLEPTRDVVTCSVTDSLAEAARRMTARRVGSILVVDEEGRPRGILTDSDLRGAIAEELDSAATPVSARMSTPVSCVPDGLPMAELTAQMLSRRIHHVAVTEDGTDGTPLLGVLSEHDVLRAQGSLPTVLRSQIRRARSGGDLKAAMDGAEGLLREYLEAEVSMQLVAAVSTALNDRLLDRCIALAGPAPGPYCWLAMGSEGRGEQLLRTDLDNALIRPEDGDAEAYLAWAAKVIDLLNAAGFARCPAGMMADQAGLNLTPSEWRERFGRWIEQPTARALMMSTIYFDLRPVAGDVELGVSLRTFLRERIAANHGFLPFLAKNALANPPPLSFFRNFVVERSGEHRNAFDLKARAMMPLTDAARVLDLDPEIGGDGSARGTPARFRNLRDPNRAELYEEAALAYELLMRLRARQGLAANDSGRFLPIDSLGQLERESLRSVFAVIGDVQRVLASRYRTDFIR
jgi:CBS domain-containing protein